MCDQQNKEGITKETAAAIIRASLVGGPDTIRPPGRETGEAKVSNGKMDRKPVRLLRSTPPAISPVPVCRASKPRWWSLPPRTSSGTSALSAACGPGGTPKMKSLSAR